MCKFMDKLLVYTTEQTPSPSRVSAAASSIFETGSEGSDAALSRSRPFPRTDHPSPRRVRDRFLKKLIHRLGNIILPGISRL